MTQIVMKKYYYRNKDGELAWHDNPAPEYGKENAKSSARRLGTNAWATGCCCGDLRN